MKFLVNLNLLQNELQNAVLQPLATAPSNPKLGQIYYNSTDKLAYIFDGTAWASLGAVVSVNSKTGVVVLTQDDVGDGATYVRTHNDLTDALLALINGSLQRSGGTMTGALTLVGDPSNANEAATKNYVDSVAVGALRPAGSVAFASLPALTAANLNKVVNVTDAFTTTADFVEGAGKAYPAGTNVAIINTGTDAEPVYKYDAMTGLVDLSGYLEKAGGTMTGDINMGSHQVTGLGTPTNNTDAATKKYVDDAVAGGVHSATGTIGTSATSASVSYTGTLVNAYALQGGEIIQCDIAVASTSVTFSVAAAPSSAITCVVIYA